MSGIIRRARSDERSALLALWERSVRATHTFLTDADIDSYRPLTAEILTGGALVLWVIADNADRPSGFLGRRSVLKWWRDLCVIGAAVRIRCCVFVAAPPERFKVDLRSVQAGKRHRGWNIRECSGHSAVNRRLDEDNQ